MSHLASTDVAVSESVSFDTPCRACGYSLRWQPTDGRCPECGLNVGESLRGDILAQWDPAHVRRKATAMRVVLWGTFAFLLVMIVGVVINANMPYRGMRELVWRVRANTLIEALGVAGMAWAHWRLGAPSRPGDARVRGRRLYRAAVVLVLALLFTGCVMTLATTREVPTPVSRPLRAVQLVVGMSAGAAVAAAYAGGLAYLRGLARLIPRDRLAWWATVLAWVCTSALLAYVVVGVAISIWQPIGPLSKLLVAAFVAAALFGATFLVGTAAAAVLLHRLRVHYTRAANRAAAP